MCCIKITMDGLSWKGVDEVRSCLVRAAPWSLILGILRRWSALRLVFVWAQGTPCIVRNKHSGLSWLPVALLQSMRVRVGFCPFRALLLRVPLHSLTLLPPPLSPVLHASLQATRSVREHAASTRRVSAFKPLEQTRILGPKRQQRPTSTKTSRCRLGEDPGTTPGWQIHLLTRVWMSGHLTDQHLVRRRARLPTKCPFDRSNRYLARSVSASDLVRRLPAAAAA